jgi:hypothetical protein
VKKRIHHNSLEAFDTIEDERGERAELIYRLLIQGGRELTDRQIMTELGFGEPNAVRPRISELVGNRWLVECGTTECPVTGKHVRRVRALTADERADLIQHQRASLIASRSRATAQLPLFPAFSP